MYTKKKIQKITKTKWFQHVQTAVKTASEAADVIARFEKKPGVLGTVAMASRVIDMASRVSKDIFTCDFFTDSPDWKRIGVKNIKQSFVECLMRRGNVDLLSQDIHLLALSIDIDDFTFGWLLDQEKRVCSDIFIPKNQDYEASTKVLSEFPWCDYGDALVVIEEKQNNCLSIGADTPRDTLNSSTAQGLWRRLRAFQNRGINRSVLLVGPPGTGKSHIIRAVAKYNGGRSFRINASLISKTRMPANAIQILAPDAILIDDIDRAGGDILEQIDDIKNATPLILATANNATALDVAAKRPGRFDEIFWVGRLDQADVEHMIGHEPNHIKERLQKLPVAFIQEYLSRETILGPEEAAAGLEDLERRTEEFKTSHKKQWEDLHEVIGRAKKES